MPWLNWSSKLHIRLRIISLLISTHNTQVYVQWMSYSFVWLYLIKCVFTCSIFVDSNIKRFLSVLVVFGKYFVFTKIENFKNCVALFWRLSRKSDKSLAKVASSRVDFGDLFTSGHKDFCGSACDSFVSKSSQSRKTLKNFFKNLVFKVFRGLPWRLDSVAKIACFPYWGLFSRLFSKTFHFSLLHHYQCSYLHVLPSFLIYPFVYSCQKMGEYTLE